jgi:hypothetical protein
MRRTIVTTAHLDTEPEPLLGAAADWHDRWLPGTLHRLQHGPFALDCSDNHKRGRTRLMPSAASCR